MKAHKNNVLGLLTVFYVLGTRVQEPDLTQKVLLSVLKLLCPIV